MRILICFLTLFWTVSCGDREIRTGQCVPLSFLHQAWSDGADDFEQLAACGLAFSSYFAVEQRVGCA